MSVDQVLGRLLGFENVSSVDEIVPSFGAPWAREGPAWVFFGCLGLTALSFLFYVRFQRGGHVKLRLLLATGRSLLLCLLFLTLADPILELKYTHHPRSLLWVLFDGTESMAIEDEYPSDERALLSDAVALPEYLTAHAERSEAQRIARNDLVRALLEKPNDNLLNQLAQRFRLQAYLFEQPDGVRRLELSADGTSSIDPEWISRQLTTDGQVTAIGNAFDNLATRRATANLAGVLVFSDFDQNTGTLAVSAARKLGVPVYTVGIGPQGTADLSLDLQTPPRLKKAERATIHVTLRQQQFDDRTATVRVVAQPADSESRSEAPIFIGEETVPLTGPTVPVEFSYVPEETGRFTIVAEVEPFEEESVRENNRSERSVTIIDDFLRLLFVEHEPTWEWRFLKEVFHRDKLVGMRGFRTYLRSADPHVRETNELFLPSLTLSRGEFFQHDVIFLGDVPRAMLDDRFCEMVREFVGQFGGGLVVVAGPRFGPGQLADTPLAEMLPVIVDPDAGLRDDRSFELQRSPLASQYDFMQLGNDPDENERAWANLGPLPWYQPVARLEAGASTLLAGHPTDTCIDGQTPQPLIAIRQYGRGEVVYIGFNETWRLRRRYGELYYRQFWGQLIHRLGLNRAIGNQKRFLARTDRESYQADDQVLLTVEAYDRNFEPLDENALPENRLDARLIRTGRDSADLDPFPLTQLRPGLFEARIPIAEGGEYRVQVDDPLTDDVAEVAFQVAGLSIERRSVVRNTALQHTLATETNGRAYELYELRRFLEDFDPPRLTETNVEVVPLWSTWIWFATVVTLMIGEWFLRKLVNLA